MTHTRQTASARPTLKDFMDKKDLHFDVMEKPSKMLADLFLCRYFLALTETECKQVESTLNRFDVCSTRVLHIGFSGTTVRVLFGFRKPAEYSLACQLLGGV
jgi:hypothetical protein